MKCGTCEYDTDTQIPAGSTVAEKLQLYGIHRSNKHTVQEDIHPELGQDDTDTDNGDNYNARTLLEASLDTDHYGDCWEESEPCQGEVCRYDPEGEYDTDTGNDYKSRTR